MDNHTGDVNGGTDGPLDPKAEAELAELRERLAATQSELDMKFLQSMEVLWMLRCRVPNRQDFEQALKDDRKREYETEGGLIDEPNHPMRNLSIPSGEWEIAGAWGAAQKHPALRAVVSVAPRFVLQYPLVILHQADLLDRGVVSADDIERRVQTLQGQPAGPGRDIQVDQLLGEFIADALEEAAGAAVAALRGEGVPPADRVRRQSTLSSAVGVTSDLQLLRRVWRPRRGSPR